MLTNNRFYKKVSWNLFSNVMYAFSQWIIIVIISKFGDGKMLGQYSLAFSITAPIVLFCGLSLRSYQITDVKNMFSLKDYVLTRRLTNYFSLIIIVIFILISKYDFETNLIIIIIGLNKLIDGLNDIVQGDFQLNDNLEKASKLKVFKSLFFIVSTILSFYLFDSFIYILLVMTLLNYAYYYFVDFQLIKKPLNTLEYNINNVKLIIITTWTMGLNISLSSLTTNIPRVFVEKYDGLEVLGYFTAISYFMLIGTLFVTAIGQATSTNLSKSLEKNDINKFKSTIRNNINFSLILGIFSIIFSIFWGEKIIKLLYGSQAANYSDLLIILMIATTFNFITSPYSYGIISLRIMKKQPLITLISLGISLSLSYVLIPFYGVYGAGYIILISSIQQFFMKKHIFNKALKTLR